MKFNRLKIHGFKTFVEQSDMPIDNGLTGIVGPNGCGKSNLVESLRWVMGENSFKNMRASGMDEVIFSGSSNRPARNVAEVQLVVDNRSRTAPAPFNDSDLLEVSRRINREQGSTYRINGKEVRARDVQLLFADASTGARSPALVRQGQIAEIVNAKPQARRRVLEEAAGISGLHARRQEAETRLKGAEQNLDRLEDVLARIETELESLKRQARHALRYRALSSEIHKCEAAMAFIRLSELKAQVADGQTQLQEAQRNVDAATLRQTEAVKAQAIAAHHLPALRDKAAMAGAALQHLVITREQIDGEERRIRERLAELESRIVQIGKDVEREKSVASDAAAVMARLQEEAASLKAESAGDAARATALGRQLDDAEKQLAESETRLAELTNAQANHMAEKRNADRRAHEAAERLRSLHVQQASTAEERRHLAQASDFEARLAALQGRVGEAEAALHEVERQSAEAERGLAEAMQKETEARKPLTEADRSVQRLEGEVAGLKKLLAPLSPHGSPAVSELVHVDKGYEMAFGVALGDDLDAPADVNMPMHWAGAGGEGDPALPHGAIALSAHVRAPEVLSRRLAQVGLVRGDEGKAMQPLLKPGQRLVSLDGDLWRWDGFVAQANAPTAAARRLTERNRLADLEIACDDARKSAEVLRAVAQGFSEQVKAARGHEQAMREAWKEAQRRLDTERQALQRQEREARDMLARLAALDETLNRLGAALVDAAAAKDEADAAQQRLAAATSFEAELGAIRLSVSERRAEVAEHRAAFQTHVREVEMRQMRLAALERDGGAWASRASGSSAQIAALERRFHEADEERKGLLDIPHALAEQRRSLLSAIHDAEAAQKSASDQLVEGEKTQAETDRMARAALEALSAAREQTGRAEERLEASRLRLQSLISEIESQFAQRAEALPRIGAFDPDAPPRLKDKESEHQTLCRERERLGAVNLRADQELKEVQESFDTMIRERDDLIEAIRKLRGAIGALNREGRERLLASFEVVNGNFKRLFTRLFGGGNAELQLIESDDPLEAGLDILANPPGKKPQTLSLLSGGEQALTAIALIFAVFLTNPAPICVLDEVDAPLDDANVERYCDLLDEMTCMTATRFLVITHNPITMSRMDRLYGVTMVERGVSQLVSVDLEVAERLAAE